MPSDNLFQIIMQHSKKKLPRKLRQWKREYYSEIWRRHNSAQLTIGDIGPSVKDESTPREFRFSN